MVGVVLTVTFAAWALLAHPGAPDQPGYAGLALVGAVAWFAGVWLARLRPDAGGATVAAVVAVLFLVGVPASLSGTAAAPPLGYANANAALLTAAVAGLLCAASVSPERRRWFIGLAALFTLGSMVTGSRAGAATSVLLLIVWPLLRHGAAWVWQVASSVVLVAGFAVTAVLGATYDAQRNSDLVQQSVSEVRVSLWADALRQFQDHPVRGVGPGNFALQSPTARSDPDLAWAHALPMQVLAELGAVGFLLLAGLVCWMVWRLRRASVVLALMALQPMVDYVLDFHLVVICYATVLGALTVTGVPRRRPAPPGQVRAGSGAV